jgi:hypothetical protein
MGQAIMAKGLGIWDMDGNVYALESFHNLHAWSSP